MKKYHQLWTSGSAPNASGSAGLQGRPSNLSAQNQEDLNSKAGVLSSSLGESIGIEPGSRIPLKSNH